MTQNDKGSYGIQWPRWYVYWRGRMWLRYGLCPNCYSSPPNDTCFICKGAYEYGPRLAWGRKIVWLNRWNDVRRYQKYKHSIQDRIRQLRTRKMVGLNTECDCTPHDITTPGAAHADDCPQYDWTRRHDERRLDLGGELQRLS